VLSDAEHRLGKSNFPYKIRSLYVLYYTPQEALHHSSITQISALYHPLVEPYLSYNTPIHGILGLDSSVRSQEGITEWDPGWVFWDSKASSDPEISWDPMTSCDPKSSSGGRPGILGQRYELLPDPRPTTLEGQGP